MPNIASVAGPGIILGRGARSDAGLANARLLVDHAPPGEGPGGGPWWGNSSCGP